MWITLFLMELYTIVCNSSMCLLQSLSTQNRVWLAKNENSNICCCNWVIANFILTTNLCVLYHKGNQVICDKKLLVQAITFIWVLFYYYYCYYYYYYFSVHSSHYPWILFSSFVDSVSMPTEHPSRLCNLEVKNDDKWNHISC